MGKNVYHALKIADIVKICQRNKEG